MFASPLSVIGELELAVSWQPHVIITDIYKSEQMDGIEMIGRLKADDRTKHIPVIVASAGGGNPERRQQALDAGAVIAKPLDPVDLVNAVRDAVGE